MTSGRRVNGTLRGAAEVVCRKQPHAVLSYGDGTAPTAIPSDEGQLLVVTRPQPAGTVLRGRCYVIDGDTIEINNIRIRLAGIDAPELDHPWGRKSKSALIQLCMGQTVTARFKPVLSYDRRVAECFLPDGRDLAAELVRIGLALDWPTFSGGKYRHLEPEDARRKLWRAAARQRGILGTRMPETPRARQTRPGKPFPGI